MPTRNTIAEMDRALDRYELFGADLAADRLLSALDERRGREMQAADNEDGVPDRYDMRDINDQEQWR